MAKSGTVLIVVDTSDLERVAEKLHISAAATQSVMQEALRESAVLRKETLVFVTPRSEDRDSSRYPSKSQRFPGHLRDSYYVTIGQSDATVGTNDANKWNIVNTAQNAVVIRPLFKKALSWPGMTGPVSKPEYPWWPPTEGYPVSPIMNYRGWTHPGHPAMNLLGRTDTLYEGMDKTIMQNLADSVMESIIYDIPSITAMNRKWAKGGFGLPGVTL